MAVAQEEKSAIVEATVNVVQARAQSTVTTKVATFEQKMQSGYTAGLFGGAIFGAMMAVMGMLPMIAMMIGSENPVTGFITHMIISLIIGGTYAVLRMRWSFGLVFNVAFGALYGMFWWVGGALIMMPLALGMNDMVLVIGEVQTMSLIGHLIFGITMAVIYELLVLFQSR